MNKKVKQLVTGGIAGAAFLGGVAPVLAEEGKGNFEIVLKGPKGPEGTESSSTERVENKNATYQIYQTKEMLDSGALKDLAEEKKVGDLITYEGEDVSRFVEDKGQYTIKQVDRGLGYLKDKGHENGPIRLTFPLMNDEGKISETQSINIFNKNELVKGDIEFKKSFEKKEGVVEGKDATFRLKLVQVPSKIEGNDVVEWETLEEGVEKSPITGEDILKEATTDDKGMVSFKDLEEGIYELYETKTDGDSKEKGGYAVDSLRRTVKVTVDSKSGREVVTSVKDVNDETEKKLDDLEFINYLRPTIKKKIVHLGFDGDEEKSEEYEGIGVNVETDFIYRLKIDVPKDIDSYVKFKFNDTLDSKLSLKGFEGIYNNKGEKITSKFGDLGEDSINTEGEQHTIDVDFVTADSEGKPVLNEAIKEYAGQTIYFDYKAVMTKDAINSEGNHEIIDNDFTLEYHNGKKDKDKDKTKEEIDNPDPKDPNDPEDPYDPPITSEKVKVTPMSLKIDLTKTAEDEEKKLSGAEFMVFKKKDLEVRFDGKLPTSSEVTAALEDNTLERSINDLTGEEIQTVESDSEGNVNIERLPLHDYVIYEIKAPKDYRLREEPIEVNIDDKKVITVDSANKLESLETVDAEYIKQNATADVVNYKVDENIISTGETATKVMAGVGVALLAAGVVMKKKEQEQ